MLRCCCTLFSCHSSGTLFFNFVTVIIFDFFEILVFFSFTFQLIANQIFKSGKEWMVEWLDQWPKGMVSVKFCYSYSVSTIEQQTATKKVSLLSPITPFSLSSLPVFFLPLPSSPLPLPTLSALFPKHTQPLCYDKIPYNTHFTSTVCNLSVLFFGWRY